MRSPTRSAGVLCGAIVLLVSIAACSKQQPQQAVASTAPAPSVAASMPPPPDPNQQLTDRLSELGASHADGAWVVSLPTTHFKSGQTTFEPEDAMRIERVAVLMKDRPDVTVLVQAFTDSRGGSARNLQLSQQRADAVARALMDRGIDADRIRAEGRGEQQPIASNDDAEGRSRNRRVQIEFSDVEGQFAAARPAVDKG